MNSKYFNVTVKPDMTGNNAVTAFGSGDLMFDWTEFSIPKGGARLIGVTALVKGADIARQEIAMDIYFAKPLTSDRTTAPTSLGTVNGTAAGAGFSNELLGALVINAEDYRDHLDNMSVAHVNFISGAANTSSGAGFVLDDVTHPYNNPSYNKYYIGVCAGGAFDFGTGVLANDAVEVGATTFAVDGNAASKAFGPGDVIVDNGNAAIGTVKTVSTTSITLESGCTEAVGDDDEIVPKNPITFILHFES